MWIGLTVSLAVQISRFLNLAMGSWAQGHVDSATASCCAVISGLYPSWRNKTFVFYYPCALVWIRVTQAWTASKMRLTSRNVIFFFQMGDGWNASCICPLLIAIFKNKRLKRLKKVDKIIILTFSLIEFKVNWENQITCNWPGFYRFYNLYLPITYYFTSCA